MRTPRGRPDLKLAESYIPAAITFAKGLLYTCALCLLWRLHIKWMFLPPLLWLYYDHLLWPASTFVDSTSLCVDVVGGTILALMRQGGGDGISVWVGLAVWSLLGSAHVVFWPSTASPLLSAVSHISVPTISLTCILAGNSTLVSSETPQWPFVCRSTFYLLLCIIDAYALRPPTQRERDKVCLMRYGALLLAPMLPSFLACCAVGMVAQAVRLYYFAHDEHPPPPPVAKSMEEGFLFKPKASSVVSSSSNVDNLSFEEAFRLAKLQHDNGKSSH